MLRDAVYRAVAGALRRHVAGHGQKNAPKPNDLGAFKMVLKYRIGGDGGNRTRVRKSATRGPTC